VRGWLLPSRNGAAIVFVHGSSADRRQLLPEARVVAAAGYGAMLFDLPGNGESDGERWNGLEQGATIAALGALASQPGTDPRRIGAFGFSIGAAVVASVASDPRWRGFGLAGCFTDVERHKRDDYAKWGPLSQLPVLWVDRAYASGFASLRPIDQVAGIAPRPLLLLSGEADTIVAPAQARALYAAASEPKDLWVVPGAAHGDYSAVAPGEYAARLVRFFDRALE
jgi:dipeptidyl aminopeptidase/acylaminoacyl peptidase